MHPPPLTGVHSRPIGEQGPPLGEECEEMAVSPEIPHPLDRLQHVPLALPQSADEVGAETLRPEEFRGPPQYLPILLPTVRAVQRLPARGTKEFGGGRVQGHGEDVGPRPLQIHQVLPDHSAGVGEDRDGDMGQRRHPSTQQGQGIRLGIRVGDHGQAHALEGTLVLSCLHVLHQPDEGHRGPVHPDEVALRVGPFLFPVARQSAVGAVGPAPLGVGEEDVEAVGAVHPVHPPGLVAQGDGGGGGDLHLLRGAGGRQGGGHGWR